MTRKLRRSLEQIRAALDAAGGAVQERCGKSRARQALEMLFFRVRGYSPDDYYTLRLYERGPAQGGAAMRHREFSRLRRNLNPQQAEVVPFNKWVAALYLESLGVRVPASHGLYHRTRGVLRDGRRLTGAAALAELLAQLPAGAVIKPLDASHGRDVTVIVHFDPSRGVLARASGAEQTLESLVNTLDAHDDGWVVQDRVMQHPLLAALHPHSVNSVRIVTLCGADGVPEVIAAVLRVGTRHAEVDNTTGGGIVAPIDLGTGRCGRATSRFRVSEHVVHPQTGARIEGLELPHWPAVLAEVVRAHERVPFPRTLGWDVAIADDGPVILELNSGYYHNHLQLDGGVTAVAELRAIAARSAAP